MYLGYFSREDFIASKEFEFMGSKISPGAYWFDKFGNERLVSAVIEKGEPIPSYRTDFEFVGELTRFSRLY